MSGSAERRLEEVELTRKGQSMPRCAFLALATAPVAAVTAETGFLRGTDQGTRREAVIKGAPVTTADAGADRAAGILAADLPDGYPLYLAPTHAMPHRLVALAAKGRLVLSDDGGATRSDASGRS